MLYFTAVITVNKVIDSQVVKFVFIRSVNDNILKLLTSYFILQVTQTESNPVS